MNGPCSIALLESALVGSLPAEDEASLHRHLEECEACSAALERMSGGTAWCQEAASLLAGDEFDDSVPTRDEWSDVDFTVEHLEPANEPNVLGRLGGYDVLDVIGRGGMGVVLKGFDRELKRSVAIKVLAPHLAQSSLARKRFAREAQAAAAVVHPHVLAIHQVQPSGRLPFLVMPLVAGESLAERLAAQGTLELKEILRIGMQAAAGLAAAHEQGLVHRDVKPANILLEKGVERAVLTDFGLACAADDVTLTRWGIIAGTPQYMSPEQARGEPLDGRSDLFSIGCVLYEMATGVSPFRTDSIMATMRRLVDDSPQAIASLNPELPPWFIAIVDRLLEKDPLRRFGSAKEVSELLEGCLAHVQQPASVPLPTGLPKPASRRGWWSNLTIKGVLAMIGTLGIGLLGVLLVTASPPDIAGEWTGEDWGTVVLTKISDTEYTGTYSDTVGMQSSLSVAGNGGSSSGSSSDAAGEIQLKWSRIERRFNGTWREGDDRFGELSLRLTGDEIRGALTTDAKSKINPATPRLADLTWSRAANGLTCMLNLNPATGVVRADATLTVRGNMQPPDRVANIVAGTDGPVAEVLVAPGQKVNAGQALIRLDCPALIEYVETNKALEKQLQASLASLKASPPASGKEALAVAQAEFEKAQLLTDLARKEATRLAKLKHAGVPTGTEEANAHAALLTAQADEKIAKARLDALREQRPLHQKRIEDVEKELKAAQAQRAESQNLLDLCTLRTPIGGIVRWIHAVSGQLVRSGAGPICQVADFREIEIRSQVHSADASQLDPTKDVDVQVVGQDAHWTGRIVSLAQPTTSGSMSSGGGASSGTSVCVPVIVRVLNPDWRLHRDRGEVVLRFKLRAATGLLDAAGGGPRTPARPRSDGDSTSPTQPAGPQPKPTRAVPKHLRQFQTAEKVVTIAYSADGRLIAVADGHPNFFMEENGRRRVLDNWILWAEILDAETGKTVVSLKLTTKDEDTVLDATERVPRFEITALAFSPDGNVLAVGTSVGQVKLFNARTGELVRSLNDERAKFADKKTPDKLKSLTRALGSVASLAFSPDGSLLAMCGGSLDDVPLVFDGIERLGELATGPGRLKVWEVKTGTLKHDLVGHSHANAVAFSPDGNSLASAGSWLDDRGAGTGAIIWNPMTGTKICTLAPLANGDTRSVAFSPSGKLVALRSQYYDRDKGHNMATVSLIDALSGVTQWQQTVPGPAGPAAFSPDGKTVVVLCATESIQFLETETGITRHEIRSADSPEGGQWNDFAITSHGHLLAIGVGHNVRTGSVALWDFEGLGTAANSASENAKVPQLGGGRDSPQAPGPVPEMLALNVARAELEKAQAAVQLARIKAARMAKLEQERFVPKDVVDEAHERVRIAEADEKIAQARLDSLLEPQPEKLALTIARTELEKAQAAAQLARKIAARLAKLAEAKAVAEEMVVEAEANVRKAEADEKIAQARLDSLLEQSGRHEKSTKDGEPAAPAAAPAGTGTNSSIPPSPATHAVRAFSWLPGSPGLPKTARPPAGSRFAQLQPAINAGI